MNQSPTLNDLLRRAAQLALVAALGATTLSGCAGSLAGAPRGGPAPSASFSGGARSAEATGAQAERREARAFTSVARNVDVPVRLRGPSPCPRPEL
ncbi:MAG: hypothetical protein IT384_25245 [Deltaproteobacteria bacterium]|nr:hypothetical protein [Deltaproteobacteria bacterium]